tara:strand:- start:486 stop:1154 length:669 start_codon:yes stop_codon:yes gene_type:complete
VIAALFNSSFEEMLFSFQDKSRSVLVSDDASATALLLILIRDDDDDEFKFVRGLHIFSQPFFAATTTREQQRGVLLIVDFSDEEETEEEEIMLLLLLMMMMPCALCRYTQRERKRAKLFFPLECSKRRSRALRNGVQRFPSSVCLSESEKAKRVFCRFRALSFSQRGFSESLLVFRTTQKEAKKASERERKRAKESAHPKKDRQTHRQTERPRTERQRILEF